MIPEDPTVPIRQCLAVVINAQPKERAALEQEHGQVWTTEELRQQFEIIGFGSPLVVVRRKSDGVKGSMFFQASPRFYFQFEEHVE